MSAQPRRIRLKPWLLAQVNSGRYPGLHWLTPDHRLFQIPWKHATRHMPTSDEENTIFKAWALETGRYQEGVDEPDPAKWKANLRVALNKSREFQLKYDGTKETPLQPYKIYEVCEQQASTDAAEEDKDEMPNFMDLSITPRINEASNFASYPVHAEANHFSLPSNGTFAPHHVLTGPPQPMTPDLSQPEFQVPAPMLDQKSFINPGPLPDLDPLPSTSGLLETGNMSGVQNQDDGQNQTCKFDLLSSIPLTDLDLKFLYRGRSMGSLTVSNPHGCRLYYGHLEPSPNQVELFGPVTLQQVRFPGSSDIQNQKQRNYTEALLDVMDRGLILEFWQQDIYAVRLCQCKVFWSGMGMPEQGPPNPMEREKKIKVFSLNDFLQGLIMFHKGEAPSPPPFETYFCFGEDWPDKKPKERKLIIVQVSAVPVVPVVARILTEMFSGDLSWSNDSIRLQISNPDVKDQTVMQFKEIQRLLQSQHINGPWNPSAS
ncbi:interferon regulatory factor 5 isoform X1 [Synchiropus splendidus]|uniref:interferon regulatory factor 5 isoform X1 n=1 Tax=Synchiropus splendidus TaxID=270530 RepID=UPI00237E4472|nr:interferon regulatory factor 5 isoform X1 [Synchiropus splendidus]